MCRGEGGPNGPGIFLAPADRDPFPSAVMAGLDPATQPDSANNRKVT
jgi:hypothetical protein